MDELTNLKCSEYTQVNTKDKTFFLMPKVNDLAIGILWVN